MKRLLLFLFVSISILTVPELFGQTVQIGSGTSTTNYFPIYSCYGYSYSQQIYLQSEISAGGGSAGNITKIRFYYTSGGTSFSTWNNWTVYMGNTAKATFSSTADWISAGSMSQVFSGTIPTPVAGTWLELTLSTPFTWDGTSNIVVAVDENAASYSCTAAWRSFASGSNRGIEYYSDSTNPDPASPPTANYGPNAALSQIQFYFQEPPCSGTPAPGNTLSSANPVCPGNNFTLSLQNATPGTGVTYQWQSSATGGAPWTNLGTASTQVTSQTASTYYRCEVTCSGNTGTSNPILVTMYSDGVPYNEGFLNTMTPSCWNITGWTIGSIRGVTGNPGNNIYKNYYSGATTGSFSTADIGTVGAGMSLIFDYKVANYSSPYGPPAAGSGNFVVAVSTNGGTSYTDLETVVNNGVAGWQTKTYGLGAYTGQNIKVRITGNWVSGDWDMAFDNIKVEVPPSCLAPSGLNATSITSNSADIGWTANSGETAWEYSYGVSPHPVPGGAGTATTNNPTPLNGLSAQTTYQFYVRANCGGGDYSSWSGPYTFTTACETLTDFIEDFDGVTAPAFPACWAKVGSGGSANTQTSSANSSPNTLYIYSSSGSSMAVVRMQPVSNLGAGTHRFRFNMRANFTANGIVEFGYLVDPGNDATFTSLGTATAATLTYAEYIITPASGSYSNYPAIRHTGVPANSLLIDDVRWESIPACPAPTSLTATNINSSSADIGWTAGSSETAWEYVYGISPVAVPSGAGTATTNNPTMLSGLSGQTTYQFYVRANCGSEFSSWSGPYTFTTIPANDDCANATAFPVIPTDGTCATLTNQSTAGATNSNVTPTGACTTNAGNPDDDVWFSFVAPAATLVLEATWVLGSTDVYWQVFSTGCSGTMTAILCTDTNGGGTITGLTIGDTYYIRLYTWSSGVSTTQNICLKTPPLPPDCATLDSPADGTTGVTLATALSWTPAATGGAPSSYKVYHGAVNPPTSFSTVTAPATSYTPIGRTYNTTYYWYVVPTNSSGDAVGCNNTIFSYTTEDPPPPPGNNEPCAAYDLAFGDTETGTTVNATNSAVPDLDCDGFTNTNPDVWYKIDDVDVFTGGTLIINIDPSASQDFAIYLYSYTDCNDPVFLACDDDGFGGENETISYTVPNFDGGSGSSSRELTSYLVRVRQWSTASGTFDLSLTGTLPLEILDIKAIAKPKYNLIEWSTASEKNTSHMVVERNDGSSLRWEEIGKTEAAGFSSDIRLYSFEDARPYQKAYYRVRSVDRDGLEQVSRKVFVDRTNVNGSPGLVNAYPLPVSKSLFVDLNLDNDQSTTFHLMTITGQSVMLLHRELKAGVQTIELDLSDLPSGVYLARISNPELSETVRIIKE